MKLGSVGELSTLEAAGQALGLTYWQTRRIVKLRNVPTVRLGNTILVKVSDVEKEASKQR